MALLELAHKKKSYFNDTERDLEENWICAFGTKEAIEKYQTSGEITKDLLISGGIAHPVRIKDANEHRERFVGDGYRYELWQYAWTPKDGIPYYVPKAFDDKNPNEPLKVFVVCHDDVPLENASKIKALHRAEDFLHEYIEQLQKAEIDIETEYDYEK